MIFSIFLLDLKTRKIWVFVCFFIMHDTHLASQSTSYKTELRTHFSTLMNHVLFFYENKYIYLLLLKISNRKSRICSSFDPNVSTYFSVWLEQSTLQIAEWDNPLLRWLIKAFAYVEYARFIIYLANDES